MRYISSFSSLLVLAGVLVWLHASRDKSPPRLSRLASNTSGVDTQTCAECHAGIVADFATSPHANTLRPGTDEDMLAIFAGHRVEQAGRTFSFTLDEGELWFGSDDLDYRRRVDWVLGSGKHALTPVSLDPDGITQLSISYFRDGEFGATPGVVDDRFGVPQLGAHEGQADARRCFGCHVSRLSENSRTNMKASLDCARCHFGADEHASSSGDRATSPAWKNLSPLESVNRCGECHRRPDEMKPEEISTDVIHLVRFAPVGLVQSKCFEVANSPENAGIYKRLDCITCHDPHSPSQSNPAFFEAICRNCHSGSPSHTSDGFELSSNFVVCSEQPPTSACLTCHMKKAEFAPGLRFTDHWIR